MVTPKISCRISPARQRAHPQDGDGHDTIRSFFSGVNWFEEAEFLLPYNLIRLAAATDLLTTCSDSLTVNTPPKPRSQGSKETEMGVFAKGPWFILLAANNF